MGWEKCVRVGRVMGRKDLKVGTMTERESRGGKAVVLGVEMCCSGGLGVGSVGVAG